MSKNDTSQSSSRLLLVSNRLPITIKRSDEGKFDFNMSSGGLVSGLSGLSKSTTFQWYGWPGLEIPENEIPTLKEQLKAEHNAVPVMLDDELADRHYNGFSNSILWPLFHYHPGEMNFDEENWFSYRQANMAFAQAIMKQLTPGSMVWVQDYHLMLLPLLLRSLNDGLHNNVSETTGQVIARILDGIQVEGHVHPKVPRVKLGFFLHTPFPSSEIYR